MFLVFLYSGAHIRNLSLAQSDATFTGNLWRELFHHRLVWAFISACGVALALWRKKPSIVIVIGISILVEVLSLKWGHRFVTGRNFEPATASTVGRFVPHPLLQGVPNPGAFGHVTHDRFGRRTTLNVGKVVAPVRVAVVGGSTTYDPGVHDNETWASQLSDRLGRQWFIENYGVPGYSSVEHLLQTVFMLRDKGLRCAIYYVGWNDLRNNNLNGLSPDYSNFHLLNQRDNLGLTQSVGIIARRSAFFSILSRIGHRGVKPAGIISSEYDKKLSRIFRQNVSLIILIAERFGIKPIFIPQVLNKTAWTSSRPFGWMPLIRDSDALKLMDAMNVVLADEVLKSRGQILPKVLEVDWRYDDFVDNGHFSRKGSSKFATAIAAEVGRLCR